MLHRDEQIKELQERICLYEDEAAYKQLFILLFPSLCGFAHSITRSRELSEEISPDIFIGLWANRSGLMKISNLKLYLFISVRNQCIKVLNREKKKHAHLSLENTNADFVSDYGTPDELMDLNDLQKKINLAVKELPPKCQLIFKLAREEKLRHKEIANLLNISIKTIDSQIAIAIKKIGNAIGGHFRVRK